MRSGSLAQRVEHLRHLVVAQAGMHPADEQALHTRIERPLSQCREQRAPRLDAVVLRQPGLRESEVADAGHTHVLLQALVDRDGGVVLLALAQHRCIRDAHERVVVGSRIEILVGRERTRGIRPTPRVRETEPWPQESRRHLRCEPEALHLAVLVGDEPPEQVEVEAVVRILLERLFGLVPEQAAPPAVAQDVLAQPTCVGVPRMFGQHALEHVESLLLLPPLEEPTRRERRTIGRRFGPRQVDQRRGRPQRRIPPDRLVDCRGPARHGHRTEQQHGREGTAHARVIPHRARRRRARRRSGVAKGTPAALRGTAGARPQVATPMTIPQASPVVRQAPHPTHVSAQTPDPAQSAHHRPHLP
jgi:hypothetical protein